MLVSIVFPEKELTNKLHSLKSSGGIFSGAALRRRLESCVSSPIVTYRGPIIIITDTE